MNQRVCITVALATITAAALSAQDTPQSYQLQLTGRWMSTQTDTNPDIENTQVGVWGTYFLAPVALGDHPWNEAAFLEHSMGVMAGLDYTKFEIQSFSADGPTIGAGFLYAEKDKPVAAQINFSVGKLDGDMGVDIDQTSFDVMAGYWLQPNALVGVEFELEDLDAGGSLDIRQTHFGAFGKIVYDLDEGRAVNAEARVGLASVDVGGNKDTNFVIRLDGDYYFTPRYSAGAQLALSAGDAASEEGVTYGVRGSAWLCDRAAVRLEYSMFNASDNQGADVNEFGIFVDVRF